MSKNSWVRIALLAVALLLFQGTWALAGTTGALNGSVTLQDGTPLAGVKVTASSPSESVSTITGSTGHFSFVSLTPDTYEVTGSKDGYDTIAQPGVSIFADNTQVVKLTMQASTKVLGHVTTTAASALVKAGTTSDVYSVSASQQAKVATLGGGGSLDAAYGAIAAVPGVVVPAGQMGWFQTIHIRGGDFDQVGYEFDGVPVLRSYDNYPTSTASALGQQELQVYTGAAPASSESQGLAGYINQVIRNGTYPGYGELSLGVGYPALYNKASLEIGGATPDRNFTYFVGVGGYHQSFRYFGNDNGASIQSMWGTPSNRLSPGDGCIVSQNPGQPVVYTPDAKNFESCYATHIGPGGISLASPVDSFNVSDVWDYENVINLHFGLPHKNDAGKDDIQLLYDNSYLHNTYYSSASDWGVTVPGIQQQLNGAPVFGYLSGPFQGLGTNGIGWQYLGKVGGVLPAGLSEDQLQPMVHSVNFAYNPNSAHGSPYFGNQLAAIDPNQRDGTANPNSIIKLQYQKNIGTSSYFRIYAYNNYSEWPQTCPNTGWTTFIGYCPLNYYVQTMTNGASASYASQINDKNLINVEVSDTFANDYRANDDTMISELVGLNRVTGADSFLYAVNANAPHSGVCYTSEGSPVSCYSGNAVNVGLANAATGAALPALPTTCGTGPCAWFAAENGRYGGGNQAKPTFLSASLTDQWKPTSQLLFNIGIRMDSFRYKLSDTGGAARDFWFNAFNNSYCVLPGGGHVPFYNGANDAGVGQLCPVQNGVQTVVAKMTNLPNDTTSYNEFEPRIGGTYTLNPNNVLRFSYGKYTQAPNTAYEQYNLLQQDLASYDANNFWPIGFTTTTHAIRPPTSNNYDFSWEHQSGDMSFKLTPFLRQTKDQIQNFFLDQKTGFVSGLNVGRQTSDGVEFELTKGDFNHNGLSGLLSATYTHSYIAYSPTQNGGSVLSTVNLAIQQYNSYTSACAGKSGTSDPHALCGTFGGANAIATEDSGIANPYFNAPARPLFDLNGNYVPFSTIPGAVEAASGSYETPFAATLVLNFKHDKWAISPQFQFFEGGYYGDPLTGYGVDPASCPQALAGGATITGDPRYKFGGTGAPFDALACTGRIPTPDPVTGNFDNLGAFRAPNQILMHMQFSYDVSPRVALTLNMANIIDQCSGGTTEPWTRFASNKVCGYTLPGYGAPLTFGSNFYNPGAKFQPMLQYPYQENPTQGVFNAGLGLKIKL
ncbi:MAG TPA: TonB-dependent receptor [Candidatus Eremiobacteraceae bacterium]